MKIHIAVCIALALCLEAAVAQQNENNRALNLILAKAGFNLWGQLLARANLTDAIDPKARATILAPDNRAVKTFLRRMSGMNFTELLAQPQLLGLMASYHLIPGVTITDSSKAYSTISTDEDNPSVVTTGDVNSILEVWSNPTSGVMTFRDVQQRVGYVTDAAPVYSGAITIWGISEVLMSGAYFDSVMDATIYYRPLTVFRELNARSASATGNADDPFEAIAKTSEPTTHFVPVDAAWVGTVRAFATNPSPGKAQSDLTQLMDYMTLNGLNSIPTGFVHNQSVETTLKGHFMSPRLGVTPGVNPFTGKPMALPSMVVIPEVGGASKVVLANVYAGKGIIHAVDNVFAPSGIPSLAKIAQSAQRAVIPPAKPPAKTAAQPSATAAQPPAKTAAQPPGKASQPPAKPAAQLSATPAVKPLAKSAAQPSAEPAAQPPAKPAAQPSSKPAAQPSATPAAQPPAKSAAQPSSKPAAQPSATPAAKPPAKPAAQPSSKPPAKPAAQPSSKPAAQPSAEPAAQPPAKPAAQPSAVPAAQSSTKAAAQPPAKAAAQPPAKAAAQLSATAAVQGPQKITAQAPATAAGQPATKPPAKTAAQPEATVAKQPPAKAAAVPAAQLQAQSTASPATKATTRTPATSAVKQAEGVAAVPATQTANSLPVRSASKPSDKPERSTPPATAAAIQPAGAVTATEAADPAVAAGRGTEPAVAGEAAIQPGAAAAMASQLVAAATAEPVAAAAATSQPPAKTGRALLAKMRLERVNNIAQVDAAAWASTNARDALARAATPGVPAAYAARYGQKYARYAECLNCKAWGATL